MQDLESESFFRYFKEICNIPHVSFHTEAIRDYVENFAIVHNFRYYKDDAGNILIYKDGAEEYKNHPAVILQGHLDMVGAKSENSHHDFLKDSLELRVENGYLKANNTTLGGDDGIAVAYMLAILDDSSLKTPPLEALFTTNEEVGLLGATAFDCTKLSGKIMLNMDSEEEGTFLVGSAGGIRADINIPVRCINVADNFVQITISGLNGGHSGDKIGTGRASSNVLIGRVLRELTGIPYNIVSIKGGEVDNAIANKTVCIIHSEHVSEIISTCERVGNELLMEYSGIDDDISIIAVNIKTNFSKMLNDESTSKVVMLLQSLPYGVASRNPNDINLVDTSLNPGILDVGTDGIKMGYSIRSLYSSAKKDLCNKISFIVKYLSGDVVFSGDYPAWPYSKESRVRQIADEAYSEVTGRDAVFKTIHAGLECGIFYDKLKDLDIISYGPDIEDIHTFSERLSIDSAIRVYELTCAILRKL